MKTAIGIGGRVLPVDVKRTDDGFSASYSALIKGVLQSLVGTSDTYDGALQELRRRILAAEAV